MDRIAVTYSVSEIFDGMAVYSRTGLRTTVVDLRPAEREGWVTFGLALPNGNCAVAMEVRPDHVVTTYVLPCYLCGDAVPGGGPVCDNHDAEGRER